MDTVKDATPEEYDEIVALLAKRQVIAKEYMRLANMGMHFQYKSESLHNKLIAIDKEIALKGTIRR